jgi:molybdopterin-containing oxidoreductase family membrane subunit
MGLVIPGFIPTPLGEIFEYFPTSVELSVAAAIWAFGILMFTLLAKAVIAIKQGKLHDREIDQPAGLYPG